MTPTPDPQSGTQSETSADVLIVGGGPAGSSTGMALARLGYDVLIVEGQPFPRFRIGETQPPKLFPLLRFLGIEEAVLAGGFLRMHANAVDWGRGLEIQPFDEGGHLWGLQVERGRFDQILLGEAEAAGCRLLDRHRVLGSELPEESAEFEPGGGVVVRNEAGERSRVRARFVVDASGPAGVMAQRFRLRRRESRRTSAIFSYWSDCRAPEFDAANTIFEAVPEGWVWSLLLADGKRNVTCAVDTRSLESPQASFEKLMTQSRVVAPLLKEAHCETPPTVHEATWYWADRYCELNFLLVGDSAYVVDPLTSQGVTKALGSGILAAAVVNTILSDPEGAAVAVEFYNQNESAAFARYARSATVFYRQSPYAEEAFWKERARTDLVGDSALGGRVPGEGEERLGGSGGEEAALRRRAKFLERIGKSDASQLRLVAVDGLVVEDHPRLENGRVVRRPAFVLSGADRLPAGSGRPHHLEIDARALLPLLDGRPMDQLYEEYAARTGAPRDAGSARLLSFVLARLAELELIDYE